jgi:serine/threonine protein kinase/Flp pilus assembly protein TadD
MGVECPKCKTENTFDSQFCKSCATPLPSSKEIPVTETIETTTEELTRGTAFASRYEIIEELGKGGMGKVYRVEDKKIKEEVALKLINPEVASDKKTLERFSNELKIARKIIHKNVGRMFDLNEEKGTHYITMEYVPGQDLRGLIRQTGQLTAGKAISITNQVCEGLIEAHGLGVVHRDLKPSNIMIDKDGNARIMDFGIARSIKGKGITRVGVMVGTPEYMSPEQAEVKEVDQRSDIYSLGVILYEMVAGRVPFEGETPLGIAMKHKSEMPKDPREINAQIPEDLSRVILRCMEKDKEKRYQSAGEVRSELERIEKAIPTTERVEPKKKPLTSREITLTFGIKRLLFPALAVFAILAIGLFIWKPWAKKTPAQAPSSQSALAVSYIENRTQEPDLDKNIMEMFTINLSRFEGIKIVSQQRLSDILSQMRKEDSETITESTALEVAKQAGADKMVVGSVFKVGDEIRMTAQLIEVEGGALIAAKEAKGKNVEDVFNMVDQLTEELSVELGISRVDAEPFKISDVTTDSLEAFSHYQKGITHLWRWESGEGAKAAEEFQKAVDIDPDFATAYVYLSFAQVPYRSLFWSPYTDLTQSKKTLKIAERLSAKIGEKERLMIEIQKAIYERDVDKTGELGFAFVGKYPDEKMMNMFLFWTCVVTGKYEEGKDLLERYLEDYPADAFTYNALSAAYAFLNDHPASISALKKYIALEPDIFNPYDSAWEICLVTGHYEEALEFLDEGAKKLPKLHWAHTLKGFTYLLMGDVEQARSEFLLHYSKGEKTASDEYYMRRNLGLSYLYEGKLEKAYAEFGKVFDVAQKEKWYGSMSSTLQNLGKILVYQGKYEEAIAAFERAEKTSWGRANKNFNPYPIFSFFHTGRAHVRKGDFDSAYTFSGKIRDYVQEQDLDAAYLDYSYFLEGDIHEAHGNGPALRDSLDKCSGPQKFGPEYNELVALSHFLMREYDQAIEIYSMFKTNVYWSRYGNDRYFFYRCSSLTDYNVGKVYELKGDKAKAIEHYEKFLDLRKDADPGIVEVEDAKKRLAGLKS